MENVKIYRDNNGVSHIESKTKEDICWGIGFAHGQDRGLQILLMRILGQGRLSELLDSSEESLAIDIFFRRMGWCNKCTEEIGKLSPQAQKYLNCYCDGINAALEKKYPWEFKLMGYKPEKWQPEDIILFSRMISYLTLAQSQAEIERLLVEMVQAGIAKDLLEELFPQLLKGLDIELLKEVKLQERIVPPNLLWNIAAPRAMASNNWVISGDKTASGKPMLANDPHLETNRLPNVWYEAVLKRDKGYVMGATMPGLPAIFSGRNHHLSWGVTYSFMDTIDSWIEKCKEGKYFREEEGWQQFTVRKEVIKRKKKPSFELICYENDHGLLDGDPFQDGYYLSTKWSAAESGAVSVEQVLNIMEIEQVEEGMDALGRLETSWNWVLADTKGKIGYQMSGLMPKRAEGISGLAPMPGWLKEYDWQGFENHGNLPRVIDPKEGYLVTANNDLNQYGQVKPINLPMGPYRAERIASLLEQGDKFAMEDIGKMHYDLYSTQAEAFMGILSPLLPDTSAGQLLKNWDLKYTPDSEGAYLFEQFYRALYKEVFATKGFGEDVYQHLALETGIFIDFYLNFDQILLKKESLWFGEKSREDLFSQVAQKALQGPVKPWGENQQIILSHILFGGKLPKFLGFDRGPITIPGGRATISQGQIYRSANRTTSFVPSFRMITDMDTDQCHTNMVGGPSDRRFSKWYCSDLKNWQEGKYKILKS